MTYPTPQEGLIQPNIVLANKRVLERLANILLGTKEGQDFDPEALISRAQELVRNDRS